MTDQICDNCGVKTTWIITAKCVTDIGELVVKEWCPGCLVQEGHFEIKKNRMECEI